MTPADDAKHLAIAKALFNMAGENRASIATQAIQIMHSINHGIVSVNYEGLYRDGQPLQEGFRFNNLDTSEVQIAVTLAQQTDPKMIPAILADYTPNPNAVTVGTKTLRSGETFPIHLIPATDFGVEHIADNVETTATRINAAIDKKHQAGERKRDLLIPIAKAMDDKRVTVYFQPSLQISDEEKRTILTQYVSNPSSITAIVEGHFTLDAEDFMATALRKAGARNLVETSNHLLNQDLYEMERLIGHASVVLAEDRQNKFRDHCLAAQGVLAPLGINVGDVPYIVTPPVLGLAPVQRTIHQYMAEMKASPNVKKMNGAVEFIERCESHLNGVEQEFPAQVTAKSPERG